MHHAFDDWMQRNYPRISFERYADDIVIHCLTERQARFVRKVVRDRLRQCGLELHPVKTKIVYCKDDKRRGEYEHVSFDFLGYNFRPRLARTRTGELFLSFLPAISATSAKTIRDKIRTWRLPTVWTRETLETLAKHVDPVVRGWINYYGRFTMSECKRVLGHLNRVLVRWAVRKYKRFKGNKRRAARWLDTVYSRDPTLFALWEHGVKPRAAGW